MGNDAQRAASLSDLAHSILKENRHKLKKSQTSIQDSFNPEAVHDFRVASRRLRAFIKTFKKYLPKKAEKISVQLGTVADILGKKRDLDLFLDFIHPTVDLEDGQAKKFEKRILLHFNSKKHKRLVKKLARLKIKIRDQNAVAFAKKHIKKRLKLVIRKCIEMSLSADDPTMHQLRIAIKKLRYVVEFFEPVFMLPLNTFLKAMSAMQNLLGAHQDTISGLALLKRRRNLLSESVFLSVKNKFETRGRETRQDFFKRKQTFSKSMQKMQKIFSRL